MGIEPPDRAGMRQFAYGALVKRSPRRAETSGTGSAPRARPVRHILHGWRRLTGQLLVQVLQAGYERPPRLPPAYALARYTSAQPLLQPIVDEEA